MTRINCGIPPGELTNKHLIAEHREIIRIPNAIRKGRCRIEGIPERFKLGTGHVKFFYDKLLYLKQRYQSIYAECKRRGFKVQNYVSSWEGVPNELMNGYTPTEQDRVIIRQRIQERLNN